MSYHGKRMTAAAEIVGLIMIYRGEMDELSMTF